MTDEQVLDIPGLSGEEIIVDLCEQIASKLRMDCNLRGADSYVNGYTAEVTLKIRCFGIDTAETDVTVKASTVPAQKASGAEKVTEVSTDLKVAHEADLQAVRERSGQTAPDVENKSNETAQEKAGSNRRRYSATSPKAAVGGAGDEDLSD